ncbi:MULTISPECIES: DUF6795 domain-containing protein [unclassified Shewanella]|uniref:DUF6795 domain-containing protein n=1 Tax=unclassified Shewanella TaxID=196818 RepID=UPI00354C7209
MNTRIFTGVIAILLLIVTVSSLSEESMLGLFKKAVDVEVFPEVSGRLTLNGEPLSNVNIKRGFKYSGVMEEIEWDFVSTDENGKFVFPELTMSSDHPNKAFTETRVAQAIMLADNNIPDYEDAYLWSTVSRGIRHISYFSERLSQLNCELSNEAIRHEVIDEEFEDGVVRYTIFSLCRWPELEQKEIEKRKIYGE